MSPTSRWARITRSHGRGSPSDKRSNGLVVLAMVLALASVFLPGDFVTGRWLTESVGVVVGVARLIILTVVALLALTLVMSEPTIAPMFSRF